jgi:hypothetical protein
MRGPRLARTGDDDRRAALPYPRASVASRHISVAPSDSSASSSSIKSEASGLPPAPAQCASSLRDLLRAATPRQRFLAAQAATTILTAFARAALARTGDITVGPASLAPCPRSLAAKLQTPSVCVCVCVCVCVRVCVCVCVCVRISYIYMLSKISESELAPRRHVGPPPSPL